MDVRVRDSTKFLVARSIRICFSVTRYRRVRKIPSVALARLGSPLQSRMHGLVYLLSKHFARDPLQRSTVPACGSHGDVQCAFANHFEFDFLFAFRTDGFNRQTNEGHQQQKPSAEDPGPS
jgi:hypothetical protein